MGHSQYRQGRAGVSVDRWTSKTGACLFLRVSMTKSGKHRLIFVGVSIRYIPSAPTINGGSNEGVPGGLVFGVLGRRPARRRDQTPKTSEPGDFSGRCAC
jgi:hypothetical protein